MGKYVGKNALTAFWNGIKAKFSDVAFSGDYDDLINKPTLGTASSKNVSSSGDASSSQVVMGNDSRLKDARPASDVSSWAKKSTKPTYTKSEVGLGNVGNFKAVSTVASQGLTTTEQANARANIGAGTSSFSGSYNDLSNKPTLGTAAAKDIPSSGNASSSQVVMGNDSRLTDSRNAKDVSSWAKASTKPSYTASEVGAIATTAKGAASGVAELDSTGKVPSSQLPSFVDDVLEYSSKSSFPTTGETGKIYVDTTTNLTYRWGGTEYVEISASLALGETSSTAYRGDRGKTAYDHSQSTHARTDATKTESSSTNGNIKINGTETTVYTHPGSGTNPHGTTKSDVGLGNVGNFKAVSTVASQGLTDTEKSNARTNIGAGTSSLALGETATTAAKGNHTHSLSMAAVTGTSSVSLSANSKYKLTAGGSTYVFTTPKDTTYSSKNAASGGTDVSLVTTGEKYTWNNKSNLALGETSSTAYRGDRGKTAYVHSQSDHSSIAPAFTEASTRANIATGESLATMFGKIKKFFTDLKKVAFTGSYSDLSDTPTIPAKALWVDMGTISSLPVTKSVTGCQTDMVVAKAELGTPSAQTGNWTFNTDTAGKVTLSGTISGSTTLKILLVQEVSVTAT